jgi:hypothetical protein
MELKEIEGLVERLYDTTKPQTWEDLTGLIAEAASALTAMAGELREARAENAELEFIVHEGGTWEQQLSASEARVAELTAEVELLKTEIAEMMAQQPDE